MKGIRIVPDNLNLDFIGLRFVAYIFSALLIIGAIAMTQVKGLNFGIDFTGGTIIEIQVAEPPPLSELRQELNNLDLGSVSIQEFGASDDLLIRLPEQQGGPEAQKAAIETLRVALDEKFSEGIDYRRTEYVGPQVGEELKFQGAMAVFYALLGILAYVWYRFEWQFGLAALIALFHDAIATIGLFALLQMEFNLSTVAAILMIAGYSINDTVVVFDRIRENLRKYKKMPLPELFNQAINQTLSRTLMTSFTTLLALVALYVFGGAVIQGFVVALLFGILIGTYSSIFVASPILLLMNIKRGTEHDESGEVPA